MNTQQKIFFSIIGILILGTLGAIFLSRSAPVPPGKYDTFAQCLASRKMTMYGATWCSHCKAEKARFGDSFKYVPYVECTETPDLCVASGVEGYPTWIDGNGVKYEGEQGLEKLSEISGCELPK